MALAVWTYGNKGNGTRSQLRIHYSIIIFLNAQQQCHAYPPRLPTSMIAFKFAGLRFSEATPTKSISSIAAAPSQSNER